MEVCAQSVPSEGSLLGWEMASFSASSRALLSVSVCGAVLLIGRQSSWVRAHPKPHPEHFLLT